TGPPNIVPSWTGSCAPSTTDPPGRGERCSVPASTPTGGRSALAGVDCFGQLGSDIEQVPDDTEVGDLEDRCLGVRVERDDRLRGLHPGTVLDRPGNTECDVQLRRDGLPRLSHLELRGIVPGVHGGTRGPYRSTQRIRKRFDDPELVRGADTATTGDDHGGLGELRPVSTDRRIHTGDL